MTPCAFFFKELRMYCETAPCWLRHMLPAQNYGNFLLRNRMKKRQPVTRSWARNDGERVRSLWWKREIAKCHWDSRWIFLGSNFFAETPEQREKNYARNAGSCSNVPEHSGLTHNCDQRWSICILEPDEGHWDGAGMACRIYKEVP